MVVLRLAVNVEHLLLLYTRLQRSYLVDHNCQACGRGSSFELPPSLPPLPGYRPVHECINWIWLSGYLSECILLLWTLQCSHQCLIVQLFQVKINFNRVYNKERRESPGADPVGCIGCTCTPPPPASLRTIMHDACTWLNSWLPCAPYHSA